MTDQRFGFSPLPPFAPAPGTPPGSAGLFGGWPPTGPLGGDLTTAVATLLALLQGQGAPFPPVAPGPGQPGGLAGAPPGAAPQGATWFPTVTQDDERRAADAFLRDLTAATLRKLYKYLESASQRQAEMAPCYPPFHQAIRAYRVHDYGQALSAGYQVYRMIAALQARHLDLPEVSDEASPSGEATASRP